MTDGIRPTAIMPIEDVELPATCWTLNQQITYDYAINAVLPMVRPGGVWVAPMPRTPLSFTELVECFNAIREHPVYEKQTMTLHDREGDLVTYRPTGVVEYSMDGGPS